MKNASDIFKYLPDGSGFVDGTVLDSLNPLVSFERQVKCNGGNCDAVEGRGHSKECKKHHDQTVPDNAPDCFKRAEYQGRVLKNCMYFEQCKNVKPICINNPIDF